MIARRTLPALLIGLTVALSGCLEDPYSPKQRPQDETAGFEEGVRRGQVRGDELAPPTATGDSAPTYAGTAAATDAEAVLRAFCGQWANWSYRTIGRQQRRLAELSTPRLARELAPSTAQRELDDTLQRDRFAVRGQVVALDVRPGAGRRRALCVTREEEIDQGRDPLGDGLHHVYFARLVRQANRWSVAAWQPQP